MPARKVRATAAEQKYQIAQAITDVLPGAAKKIAEATGCLPADVEFQPVSELVTIIRVPVPGRPSRYFTLQLSEQL